MANLNMLIGRTIETISEDGSMIHITTDDGERFRFIHHQSCCESVYIESIVGELDSLVGNPVLVAEERSYDGGPVSDYDESFTWTFYVLATIKGHVDIRWYGSSNGYYSESVDFEWLNKNKSRPSWGPRGVNNGYGVWE